MNTKTLEKEERRCRFGLWNPKKDLYARRRTRYGCIDGKFIRLAGLEPVKEKEPIVEAVRLKWWQKLWNFIVKLFKK